MWELILDFLWIVWSFFKLIAIGVYSLFQDLYREHKKPTALPPQHGRVAIVTGGSSGIGFHVTKTLCELGMHVIIVDYTDCTSLTGKETASSNKKNIEASIKAIKKQVPDAVLEGFEVDLGSIKSVHKFAHQFKSRRLPLHILINNAAVMHIPYKKTVDGIEKQIAVNFMGHFLLTILLLPVLNVSGTNQLFARVVNVSSSAHRVGAIDLTTFTSKGAKPNRYSPYSAYAQSKLAVVMGSYEMARRLKAAKCFRVTINSLHPGLVDSNLHTKATFPAPILRSLIGRFYKSPAQGADTVLYVALSPDLEKQTGGYYENCQKATSSKKSQSFQVQQAIWHTTCSVLNIDPHDLPSSRSHELMSTSGLAFSWHEDYINSPYQTNVSSTDEKPGVISLEKPLPPLEESEERQASPSHSCVIDFEKDGEPGPHDRRGSSLDVADIVEQVLQKKSDLNAKFKLEKELDIPVRNRSCSSSSEPIMIHQAVPGMSSTSRKDSAPDIFVSLAKSKSEDREDNISCREFMSTPTIDSSSSPSSTQSSKLRAVMCGSDIIYIPDDEEESSRISSTVPSGTSTPGASGTYISMEEGGLTPSRLSEEISRAQSRSGSVGHIPCIQLDESLLESLQSEPDSGNEASGFSFVDETVSKSPSQKSLFESSPMRSQTAGSSPATSLASLRSSPCPGYVSPDISRGERQFDTPDKIKTNSMSAKYHDWKEQPLKSTSPGLRDSSDDEFEDWKRLPKRRPSRQDSPSISDEEDDYRQERGRTMVRRCSRTRTPANLEEDVDDIDLGLPSPGMTNITITLDEYSSTGSINDSPEKITPYQDSVILDFVNGIITESVKFVQKSKDSPSKENSTETSDSVLEQAGAIYTSIDSVDEEIRNFMKEGNEKFLDSTSFIPPGNTSNQEQKSNPFAQKGWDRLPHDISDAELKAFAEHTILYNELMRSGRPAPVKIPLDTVSEEIASESDTSPSRIIPETVPVTPPKTLPKPKSPTAKKPVIIEQHTPPDTPSPITSEPQSPKVKVLTQEFEEKMRDNLEKSPPACPQNSPKSYSSDSDSTVKSDGVHRSSLEGESNNEDKEKKEYEKMSSSSSGDEKIDELESPDASPSIGISHIIFSPGISPVKTKTSEDMMFMFQLPSENYKKASIVELDENEKSDAEDIIQGVPLLDEESDDEEEEDSDNQFQSPIFKFHAKKDATSSKFEEEPTETSTDKVEATKDEKSPEGPLIAKKPARPAQETLTPEKSPPPVADKPPRSRQDLPAVAKKPVKSDSTPATPEKTTNESTTTSESTAEKTAESSSKDTDSPGKSAEKSVINPVAPEKSSNTTIPVQGLPSFQKPIQEPVSPETSVKRLKSVSEMKSAIEESIAESVRQTASAAKKTINPARQATSPIKDRSSTARQATSPIKVPSSTARQATSPIKVPSSTARQATSPIKVPSSTARQPTSLTKEPSSQVGRETSPIKKPSSPVRRGTSPIKEPSSPKEQPTNLSKEPSSPVGQPTSPEKEPTSPIGQATIPVKEPCSPMGQATSPIKEPSSPKGQPTSPVKEPSSPVRKIASPRKGPSSPVGQAPSPVKGPTTVGQAPSLLKEPSSPVGKEASPVKGPSISARKEASPVKGPSSPAGKEASPVKGTGSPVGKEPSPVKGPSSPVPKGASPVKGSSSPARKEASPVKGASSPVVKVTSPIKGPSSPVGKEASPVKGPSSPVPKGASPVKGPSSPVGKETSPVKGPNSPVGKEASPLKSPSSPVGKEPSPVKGPSSPVGKEASPVKGSSSPARKEASPVKGASSPVVKEASPIKGPFSPAGKEASPVKGANSPVGKEASPVKGPSSSVVKEPSPVKGPSSPVGKEASPVKGPSSPVRKEASPVKGPSSPVGKEPSPVKGPSSSVVKEPSPVKGPSSPVGKEASPVKGPSSPVGKEPSPVKGPSSSVVKEPSPVKGPSSPVGKEASPVKGPSSPVGKEPSPVKGPSSPVGKEPSPVKGPSSPVGKELSPVKGSSSPARKEASPVKGPSSPAGKAASPVKGPSSPKGKAASPVKRSSSPVGKVKQAASRITQQVSKVGSPVKQQDSPVRQATSPAKEQVSPVSASPKKATATKSAGSRPQSPQSLTATVQTCPKHPTLKALKQLEQEEKCLSFDQLSEASNLSVYAMAMSSFESDDCWFDSQAQSPDHSTLTEESEYDQIMAMYKSDESFDIDDDTISNATLHSDSISFAQSETKTEEDEDHPKNSQSNC